MSSIEHFIHLLSLQWKMSPMDGNGKTSVQLFSGTITKLKLWILANHGKHSNLDSQFRHVFNLDITTVMILWFHDLQSNLRSIVSVFSPKDQHLDPVAMPTVVAIPQLLPPWLWGPDPCTRKHQGFMISGKLQSPKGFYMAKASKTETRIKCDELKKHIFIRCIKGGPNNAFGIQHVYPHIASQLLPTSGKQLQIDKKKLDIENSPSTATFAWPLPAPHSSTKNCFKDLFYTSLDSTWPRLAQQSWCNIFF